MPVRRLLLTWIALVVFPMPALAVISAPEGSQFAYLSTGPDANGGGDTGSDLNGDGSNESDPAVLALSFSAPSAGTLSFDWDLLTEEVSGGVSDFFRVLLDGTEILSGSVLTPSDTPLPPPGLGPFVGGGIVGPDFSLFGDGRLGFQGFATLVASGSHLLAFEVYDDEDDVVDTALLVDTLALDGVVFEGFEGDTIGLAPSSAFVDSIVGNVTVEGFDSFESFDVPEPAAAWLLGPAALAWALRRRA